jgi:ribosomal protein S28E/S33
MDKLDFDVGGIDRNLATQNNFEPVPVGDYLMLVESLETKHPNIKGTKSPDASKPKYMSLKLKILDGEYKARIIFAMLGINDADETARNRERAKFAKLVDAVGLTNVTYAQEVTNKPFIGSVGIIPKKDDWPAKNVINDYKPANAHQQSAAKSDAIKKPWE